jgi:replicative DNA helicase
MRRVVGDGGDVDEQIAEVQRLAMSMESERTVSDVYDVATCASQIALDTQNGSTAIPFGFRALDRMVPGANPGDLILVAARPSMGKTALACGVAVNMAQRGKRVLILTLEMTARSLIERLIATHAGVSLSVIKQGPPKDVLDRFYQASLDLEKLPIRIVENATTPERQAAVVQTMKQGAGVDVVFIDYIGLVKSGQRTTNRNDEVSEISRSLKHLAQRYEVPVVALSQLNRACESRDNKRPRLSDLRDSGSLEQDADVVMFLHRPDYYRRQQDPAAKDLDSTAEILVAKQRNGPVGMVKLSFIEEAMGFFDWSNLT